MDGDEGKIVYSLEIGMCNYLLTSGRLNVYLADFDKQAQERFERLIEDMKQIQGKGTSKSRKCFRMDRKNK